MLRRIEKVENIPDFLEGVKNREEKLMGFGHRVYKNYDPRARIIKKHVDEVLEATGVQPAARDRDRAREAARSTTSSSPSRKLYPNVDFYSGLIYEALGIPTEMFTVIFAIPRTSGWVAQWMEMIDDTEQKIARPRQIYTGGRDVDYVADRRARGPEKITNDATAPPCARAAGLTAAPELRSSSRSATARGSARAFDDLDAALAALRARAERIRSAGPLERASRCCASSSPASGSAARLEISTGGILRGRERRAST